MIMNDEWFLLKREEVISPFIDKAVRKNIETNEKVISYGLSSFGYDIRLANEFQILCPKDGIIDPKNYNAEDYFGEIFYAEDHFILPAHSFVLARSFEYIKVPENMFCICIGKSTWARCGCVLNTTPAEPGWEGYLTLELSNTANYPIKLYVGEGIGQLFFLMGEKPLRNYDDKNNGEPGKYQKQQTIVTPIV